MSLILIGQGHLGANNINRCVLLGSPLAIAVPTFLSENFDPVGPARVKILVSANSMLEFVIMT